MRGMRLGVSLLVVSLGTGALVAIVNTPASLRQVDIVHNTAAEHLSQEELRGTRRGRPGGGGIHRSVRARRRTVRDQFNALDGGGANVGGGAATRACRDRSTRRRRVVQPHADPRDRSERRRLQCLSPPAVRRRRRRGRGRTCIATRSARARCRSSSQRNTPHLFAPGGDPAAGRGDD